MVDFDIRNKPVLPLLTCGLLSGLAIAAPGCDDGPLGDIAEQCGLVCPDTGIAEGNASISGFANVDAFFSAVITVRDAAFQVSGTVRGELESMAASLEIEGYADMSLGELSAAVTAGLEAKFAVALDGGLQIKFEPAKCEASLDVAVSAAAECDVSADPGSIEAKCEGSCEVSAEVEAECAAMGTLECSGSADLPNLECSGSCTGDCQMTVAATCEGTCRGTCNGTCTVTNAQGECDGACDGTCEGTCELEAGGSCDGQCEGSCSYTPPMGSAECSGSATAKCDVSAMANASCEGSCEGKVTPPEVSAECEASVEAKASASVECTPPSLSVSFQWSAELQGDVQAQAEFKAWLEGFKANFAGMLAATAKLEFVLDAAGGLVAAAGGAVEGSLSAIASGDLDLKGGVGIACALTELESVGTALASATSEIEGSISASASIAGTVGG